MLGVLGADPAVVRAAADRLGLALARRASGLVEALDLEVALGVAVDEGLEGAVLGARAREDHAAVALDQLRVEQPLTARADRLGAGEPRRPGGSRRRGRVGGLLAAHVSRLTITLWERFRITPAP